MAQDWVKISEAEATKMFREAIGALTYQVEQADCIEAVTKDLSKHPHLAVELPVIVKSMTYTTFSALGTFAFVYPYERYKKIASRYPDRHLDVSQAFGLNDYSDRETFSRAFPRTIIHEWGVQNRDKPSWFADCMRNSFAHAQSSFVQSANMAVVEIMNSKDGISLNFSIEMLPEDFWRLVQQALRHFLANIVDPPHYPALEKLLVALTA